MKSMLRHALALAAALAVPAAMADETKTKSTTATSTDPAAQQAPPSSTDTIPTSEAPPGAYGGGPTAPTTTTTETTTTEAPSETSGVARADTMVMEAEPEDRPVLTSGIGFNVFGVAGSRDSERLGLGGRIEFIFPFGLTLGGSFTQHWESERVRRGVRPLLGEVGVAIPVARRLELRPMVGLGYAFVSSSEMSDDLNNTSTTTVTNSSNGFDVAPGAKVSYLAGNVIEIYTLPKYHFISGNNFLGVELGAGARF